MQNPPPEIPAVVLDRQVKVSKMLGMAFAFSITGIAGIGSFMALVLGWKALRIIRRSNERINGRLMAWWCILAGALGTLIFPAATIAAILKK